MFRVGARSARRTGFGHGYFPLVNEGHIHSFLIVGQSHSFSFEVAQPTSHATPALERASFGFEIDIYWLFKRSSQGS